MFVAAIDVGVNRDARPRSELALETDARLPRVLILEIG